MYRVEFFDYDLSYRCSAVIDDTELSFDYLTLDASKIVIPSLNFPARVNYFARILSGVEVIYDGIVSDVQPGDDNTEISVRPLLSILDIESNAIGADFSDAVEYLYSNIVAELHGYPVIVTTSVSSDSRPYSTTSDTVNLATLAGSLLTTYGIVIDCKLDFRKKSIDIDMHTEDSTWTLEADLKNVIEKKVTLGNGASYQKCRVYETSTDTSTNKKVISSYVDWYVSAIANTIVSQMGEYRKPVLKTKYVYLDTCDNWAALAKAKATEALMPQHYDNEIDIQCSAADKILRPLERKIGTVATIYTGKAAYTSMLTSMTRGIGVVTLKFGAVRVDLTKKLILERRKS